MRASLSVSTAGEAACSTAAPIPPAARASPFLAPSPRRRRASLSSAVICRAEPRPNDSSSPELRAEATDGAEAPLLNGAAAIRARAADPYRAAGQRLESLLAGVGDGEEEMLNAMLREESAEKKLLIALGAGVILSGGAVLACWLCGLDPMGGASLSLGTLRAAAFGAAAAVPLVAVKALLWSDAARAQLPFLEDVQHRQVEEFQPLLDQLSIPQCMVVLGSEVIPGLLILLPAATGGIAKTLQMYCGMSGIELPVYVAPTLALLIASLLAALSKLSESGVTAEEFNMLKDALDNADRYYKVMAPGREGAAGEPAAAEAAFRAVAVTWLARRLVAARFTAGLAAGEVLFLGLLWQETGDLAAPMIAALASSAVDFGFIRRLGDGPAGGSEGPSVS